MTPKPRLTDRRQADRRQAPRSSGFILVVVLWIIVLLTLLTGAGTTLARREIVASRLMMQSAQARALADGLVETTVFHLLTNDPAVSQAGGMPQHPAFPGAIATLVVLDHDGRMNPSVTPPPMMRDLLRSEGVDDRTAAALAAAIADWVSAGDRPLPGGAKRAQYQAAGRRYGPPGEAYASTAELGLVLGMTQDLLARLEPHLSVWTDGTIDAARVDPVVARAFKAAERSGDGLMGFQRLVNRGPEQPRIVEIRASVRLSDARAARTVIGRITPGSAEQAAAWRILAWQ